MKCVRGTYLAGGWHWKMVGYVAPSVRASLNRGLMTAGVLSVPGECD